MNPIPLIFAAGYGYLAGNPAARKAAFNEIKKLSGMVVDGLNKQGDGYVPKSKAVESSEQSED